MAGELHQVPQDEDALNLSQSEAGLSLFLKALVDYMAVIGKLISADELVVGLPVSMRDFAPSDAPRALRRLGYVCKVGQAKRIDQLTLPACVKLKSGEFVTIITQQGNSLKIVHSEVEGGFREVSYTQINSEFSGEYILVSASVEALENKHVGSPREGHWFWKHLADQKWLSLEVFVATLIANCLAVAVSLFALQVYDRVIPNASTQTLWVLATGAFVAIVFEMILKISRGRLIDDMGRQVEMKLSAELVTKLQNMRMNDRAIGPAALGSMMREFSAIREFFTATAMGSMADIPFVFIFLALIYSIAGPVVLVPTAAVVLIVVTSLLTRRALGRISEDMQGANAAQARLLNELTYGAEAIKLNRAENKFQSAWEDLSQLISSKTQDQRATSARLSFISQGIQQVAYVSAVVAGVYLVFAGSFSIGAIIAISILSTRAIAPITQLSSALARWQQVRVALDGLSMVAHSKQERDHTRTYSRRENLSGKIVIQDLIFRYAEDQDIALKIEKLGIKPGENMAILGRNGSGKSTLLKILSGLYAFEQGEVRLDGLDIRQLDPVDLRRNMGVLTQDVTLFTGTLRDNLKLGPRPIEEHELEEALRFSGLWQMAERHPLGMDMPVSDGGMGLSVGQRQSLGLSRIYIADPQIVLLDEPTAAMDQTLEAEVIGRLNKWLEEKTCILTTHRTEIIEICDRIAVMQEGKLALVGPKDEILEKLRSK